MNGVIDGASVIFGAGMVVGILACIIIEVTGVVVDELARKYARYIPREQILGRIDQEKAKCSSESAYIDGWNDCIDAITKETAAGGKE